MGRPRLKNNERPFSVNVYLTAKEWLILNSQSKEQNITKSAFIRRLLSSIEDGTIT